VILRNYTSRIFDIVDDMEGAISDLRDTAEGRDHIGASNTPGAYIMPIVMADYKKKYPLVTCSMTVGDTSEIEDLVNKGTVLTPLSTEENGIMENRIITQKLLFTDRLIFVSSPDNESCRERDRYR
jgi:DNA-binding transcriptional LysR family regulator